MKGTIIRVSLLDCDVVYCDILCGKSSILVISLCSVLYTLPSVYFINDSDSSQLYSLTPLKRYHIFNFCIQEF